jgi:hypothetical protein
MGNTVTMRKGVQFADVFDSPETISQAQKDGYHLCSDEEVKARQGLTEPAPEGEKPNVGGSTEESKDADPPPIPDVKTGLAALGKKELLEFIGKRKLFEKSYKDMEPEAIIPLFLKAVREKVVDKKVRSADEAAAMPEKDLLAVYDDLKLWF